MHGVAFYILITLSDTIRIYTENSDSINVYCLLIFTAIITVVKMHVYFGNGIYLNCPPTFSQNKGCKTGL